MQAEDAQGPFLKLAHMVHAGINPAAQARLAEELANAYGKLALAPVRSSLSTEAWPPDPYSPPQLALFEANPDLARWYLIRTQPAQLSSEERANGSSYRGVWTRLRPCLIGLPDYGKPDPPPELVQPFADKALEFGQVGMHDLIWRSLH